MPVVSAHVFTVGTTQYDLRQAVMWALESATVVRVHYRGAPEGTWIRHVLADWVAAKQTSLGTTIAASPHIFSTGSSFWDVRFAGMWAPGVGTEIRVYYEGTNEDTWVTHPVIADWEAKKTASLGAGG